MSNWFVQSFIPQVMKYFNGLCMEFKIILVLDNTERHPADLNYDSVKIELLPPNTTSLLQPMDWGVIRAFKALYIRNFFHYLVREMDADGDFSLKNYCKKFTIVTCLIIIGQALKNMKQQALNSCLKKFWPECVKDYEAFLSEEIQHSAINNAVILAPHLEGDGFDDITTDEVGSLIDAHSRPLARLSTRSGGRIHRPGVQVSQKTLHCEIVHCTWRLCLFSRRNISTSFLSSCN